MKANELTNRELADILQTLKVTGIAPTEFEKQCLQEACYRIIYIDSAIERIRNIREDIERRLL